MLLPGDDAVLEVEELADPSLVQQSEIRRRGGAKTSRPTLMPTHCTGKLSTPGEYHDGFADVPHKPGNSSAPDLRARRNASMGNVAPRKAGAEFRESGV